MSSRSLGSIVFIGFRLLRKSGLLWAWVLTAGWGASGCRSKFEVSRRLLKFDLEGQGDDIVSIITASKTPKSKPGCPH